MSRREEDESVPLKSPSVDTDVLPVSLPAAASLAFISVNTDAAAAENWREEIEGSVEELTMWSVDTPSGSGSSATSGYTRDAGFMDEDVVELDRLSSTIEADDMAEGRRLALGSALMMRSG